MNEQPMTLEQYFAELYGKAIDFHLRVHQSKEGMEFYIYALNVNSITPTFHVQGNTVTLKAD